MSELKITFPKLNSFHPRSVLVTEEYPILGESKSMARVRSQVAFSAQVGFPVFICGEVGTEKSSLAKQIHERRGLPMERFIDVPSNIHDVAGYQQHLANSLVEARGGTLYLAEVDLLADGIKDYLISLFSGDGFSQTITQHDINLIVSCTTPIIHSHNKTQFIAKILGCTVPHLEIHIPPLRDRKEDIRTHIHYLLQKLAIEDRCVLDDVAMDLLVNYDWPENIDQLQRILCLLASYCATTITQEDILALNLIKRSKAESEPDIVAMILNQDFACFQHFHPGLKKALVYIGENFKDDITLTTLSNIACTSPSHLSFLFRNHLGVSFKTILVQVRIRYAKQQIEASPRLKITDISLQAGFGDLSHFEKMFKRYVGDTPRQYRQRLRLDKNLLLSS